MKNYCPKCGCEVHLPFVERWKPIFSKSYAFDCPHCKVGLLIDYWDVKTNIFRILFVLGAGALLLLLPRASFGIEVVAGAVGGYVVVGWFVLMKFRKVIYADNRLNEQAKQKQA